MAHRNRGTFCKLVRPDILLTTINAKWIHPSLALRLLKANLGSLEDRCEIIEFALRQPLVEKTEPLSAHDARILGVSVSIWNHTATVELLKEMEKQWRTAAAKPVVVLGGPEVSHLPEDAEIFQYADYVIRGEGENAFRILCTDLLAEKQPDKKLRQKTPRFINAENVDVSEIKSAYHLYTDEDIKRKLIYVEASRGCPFNCEYCLSAVKEQGSAIREFPLQKFLEEMDVLIKRGVKTFKFLDRTFNVNIKRAIDILNFFLEKLENKKENQDSLVVHFEMVPSLFTPELLETLARFPPETLRLEIGIQTLNSEVAARIKRPFNIKELDALRFLREKTTAIMHVDLIAGLPGEDIFSFGEGFDRLWRILAGGTKTEIQLGILKLLPGAPISRYNEEFEMCYNPLPPYEVQKTSAMSAEDILRLRNFARFWELIVHRGLAAEITERVLTGETVFENFLRLADALFARFGRNWGIDKSELREVLKSLHITVYTISRSTAV